ncbi:fimbria/pilus outer membrane usher protein [Cupriavidus campinensis]
MTGWDIALAEAPERKESRRSANMIAEVEFNDGFLHHMGGGSIDVSRFNKGSQALPGNYRVDVYVNEAPSGKAEVTLRQIGEDLRNVQPCMNTALLERIGVDLAKLSPEAQALLQSADKADGACALMPDLVEGASAIFDGGELRLDVSVPQKAMIRSARGYVDPKYWDDGITAATLQYNANVYRSNNPGYSFTRGYMGLSAGFNVGSWRFRHSGSVNYSDRGMEYQSAQTNARRSIASIKSQLVLGDSFTDGALFDSVGVRGVQLSTDDRMYPESQRGYAPIVHGIANSNARVQIRQGGNIIYETTVSPGPFEINDLYATGYGGDLEVAVTEADGSTHVSKVPYAAAVNALRPGITRYTAAAGQYRNPSVNSSPMMAQATIQHGFNNMVTGYGGAVMAEGYFAVQGGAALNTDFGAIGADVTQSFARLPNMAGRSGQSMRLSFSKLLAPTNTNIAVAAYRYSTSGYLGLADAVLLRDLDSRNLGYAMNGTPRGRLQVTLNQSLPPGYGSFYVSGSTQNYWNRNGTDTQFQAGYNNHYKRLTYGVAASRQLNLNTGKWDTRVMLNLGIPLGKSPHAPYSTTGVQYDSSGATSLQQAVTGTVGEDNAFTYGVNVDADRGTQNSSAIGAHAAYASPIATFNGSIGKSNNYSQASVGMAGGIVAYSGGVAFTPIIGETMAIVEADGASGAQVVNGSGLRVDPWGHAVVSGLSPFARNQIEIDPKGLPMNVELKSTTQQTAPTAGAVVRVKFETDHAGRAAVLRVKTVDGEPLPFGAEVLDANGHGVGTVAQGGRIIVRGLKSDSGVLSVVLDAAKGQACKISYALPKEERSKSGSFVLADVTCD